MSNNPIVYLSPAIKIKIDTYIALARGEISGLGSVSILGKKDFYVFEAFILKQKCTPVETIISKEAVSDRIFNIISAGRDPGVLKLWWHSHGNLGVFWSAQTDEPTINGFKNDWMISLVGNKSGDYLARLDIFRPVRLTLHDLPVRVLLLSDAQLEKQLSAEIEEMVTFQESIKFPPEKRRPIRKKSVIRPRGQND